MYGFGLGNNIEPWIDFFKYNNSKFELTFICSSFGFKKEDYPSIKVVEAKNAPQLLLYLLKTRFKYDVLYIHGLYDFFNRFFLTTFIKANTKCLNIWNNRNFKKATSPRPLDYYHPSRVEVNSLDWLGFTNHKSNTSVRTQHPLRIGTGC